AASALGPLRRAAPLRAASPSARRARDSRGDPSPHYVRDRRAAPSRPRRRRGRRPGGRLVTAAGPPPGKAWSGRFAQGADPTAEAFTSSLSFDRRLWPHDLAGSAAWARALARAKLITDAEVEGLLAGLDAVRKELEGGSFPFRRELEDIHMNIERRLVELAGGGGGGVPPPAPPRAP